ncbi:putative NEDD4-binding protein 1 [Sesbania bispinosa]|nr:putative NEDD4-binding protein 1 [Sesbania bispinosa]
MGTLQLLDPSWLHQPQPPEIGKRGHHGLYAVHGCPVRERRKKRRVLWASPELPYRHQDSSIKRKPRSNKPKFQALNPSFRRRERKKDKPRVISSFALMFIMVGMLDPYTLASSKPN